MSVEASLLGSDLAHGRLACFSVFGASPLPLPATQRQYPMGGREGERAGTGSTQVETLQPSPPSSLVIGIISANGAGNKARAPGLWYRSAGRQSPRITGL